jgi:hypothetical protein
MAPAIESGMANAHTGVITPFGGPVERFLTGPCQPQRLAVRMMLKPEPKNAMPEPEGSVFMSYIGDSVLPELKVRCRCHGNAVLLYLITSFSRRSAARQGSARFLNEAVLQLHAIARP